MESPQELLPSNKMEVLFDDERYDCLLNKLSRDLRAAHSTSTRPQR